MPKVVYCPFYKFHKENKIYCENGVEVFKNHDEVLEYLKYYCGDPCNHHHCEEAEELYTIYEGGIL